MSFPKNKMEEEIQKQASGNKRRRDCGEDGELQEARRRHPRICWMARIRTSRRGKAAAVSAVARDIDFGHFWRQLCAVGWTAKRPTGIQDAGRYVSPDGATVLVGEEAVVWHAIESGMLGNEKSDANESISEGETSAAVEVQVGDELFGASSDAGVALSQAAVPMAFDLSPGVLQSPEQRNATTNLQLLSEASGVESEVEPGDATVAPSRRVLRPRLQVKNDINFVPEDESLSAYESFSSGESNGEDAVDDDDGYGGSGASSDDVETVDSLSKRDIEQRAAALHAMKWTSVSSVFEDSATVYSGLNMEDDRPVAELRKRWCSPLLTFFNFMPKSLWVMITEETSRGTGHRARETLAQIRRWLKAKSEYETHEILHVIGLLVARMLCPQRRRFADHWTMTEDGAIPAGTFDKPKSQPALIPRGTFAFSHAEHVSLSLMGCKPVHYLCTGSAMTASTVSRNIERLGPITVPCPTAVNDYQRWMGRVDVHDQPRLQTFSLQTSTSESIMRAYFADLALVNAYITHKEVARREGTIHMKRGDRFNVLQKQLLQLKEADFLGVNASPLPNNQKRGLAFRNAVNAPVNSVLSYGQTEKRSPSRQHIAANAALSTTLNAGFAARFATNTRV
ncbi:hypothetical protein ON010_g10019 [Phytophthora cinnamomi]|nr:hypothetical protein ON010_g10019 [Phytophthora cinnamomi]